MRIKMNQLIKISLITLITISTVNAEDFYDVKSAKIEFEIKNSQTVGSISKKEIGKKRIVIGNYGKQELEESNSISKNTIDGKTKVSKYHHLNYLDESIRYTVNFQNKTIDRSSDEYHGMRFGTKKYKGSVDEMLKLQKMKKIGTDKVAGYTCDVWQLGKGTKTCFYKGIPLKSEMSGGGMTRVMVATKAEFDLELSDNDFKLPDFPVNGKKYTQAQLKEMDANDKNRAGKRKKEEDEAITMLKEAYKKAGVKEGKSPTKEQMKIAREYMQKKMFPIQKKKFLEETKDTKNIKNCLTKANSLQEANGCDLNGDGYGKWNSKIKEKILKKIELFETKIIPCIEKSQNAKEMEVCFPRDLE